MVITNGNSDTGYAPKLIAEKLKYERRWGMLFVNGNRVRSTDELFATLLNSGEINWLVSPRHLTKSEFYSYLATTAKHHFTFCKSD